MIETYGNEALFHNVIKLEVKNGSIDGVRTVVIHQLVETGRDDDEEGTGRFVMEHEVTCFMTKDDAPDAMTLEVA